MMPYKRYYAISGPAQDRGYARNEQVIHVFGSLWRLAVFHGGALTVALSISSDERYVSCALTERLSGVLIAYGGNT
ncbi:hypothetical protein ED28_17090 [[Pantoea] beijingensis]|uniref:Uncharacterized protein n=1 Tax=[Pantoea] beijingensis TaxID=1324864 RepID=A0A443I8T2_9GAMM|nr:hypothetical protein ED28_17090 [[Pantoea] beijingensis]